MPSARRSESDDPLLRTLSAWALARTNPADRELVKRAVREIIEAFKSEDVHVRRAAARAVADFDADPELVAPALVEALRDKDPSVVANAIDALAEMGPRALRNVNRALRNPELRFYAVRLVMKVGREAESAVPALLEALKQPLAVGAGRGIRAGICSSLWPPWDPVRRKPCRHC